MNGWELLIFIILGFIAWGLYRDTEGKRLAQEAADREAEAKAQAERIAEQKENEERERREYEKKMEENEHIGNYEWQMKHNRLEFILGPEPVLIEIYKHYGFDDPAQPSVEQVIMMKNLAEVIEEHYAKYGRAKSVPQMIEELTAEGKRLEKEQAAEEKKLKEERERIEKMEILDHVLLWGPAGTGKTTMARIVCNSLEAIYGFKPNLVELTPMKLQDYDDVMNMVNQIEPGTLVFIDEIHGIPKVPLEALYNILEYRKLLMGRGEGTYLPKHTYIGATTEPGTLLEPFRERFPIEIELKPLDEDEVYKLLSDFTNGVKYPETFGEYHGQEEAKALIWMHLSALNKDGFKLPDEVQREVARRTTGIPRIAKNITRHFMSLAKSLGRPIDMSDADKCFNLLGIDINGLHRSDRRVMRTLVQRDNKPMGLAALASAAGISKTDLENMVEGRLVRLGYLERTPRGRALTPKGLEEYSK